MDYKITPQQGNSYTHLWDVASTKTFDGGFLLDKSNLPDGLEVLPKGVFMIGNLESRIAKVVKTAKVAEALTSADEVVKVNKGALLKAGDILGIGDKSVAISAVDTSNADYDSFTIEADALGELAKGIVLQAYDADGSAIAPNGLNFLEGVKIDREPAVSIMFRADGIVTSRLPQAVTPAIVMALNHCQFLDV